jgi:hypothetical protein
MLAACQRAGKNIIGIGRHQAVDRKTHLFGHQPAKISLKRRSTVRKFFGAAAEDGGAGEVIDGLKRCGRN